MIVLNHIGIATESPDQLEKLFKILSLHAEGKERVQDQGVDVKFFSLGQNNPHFELLTPFDPDGVIAKFIQKRGPGIHHLSLQVESGALDRLIHALGSQGFHMVYPECRIGANQMRINFIHPKNTGGVLFELMEKMS